jgi:hypothetical protein
MWFSVWSSCPKASCVTETSESLPFLSVESYTEILSVSTQDWQWMRAAHLPKHRARKTLVLDVLRLLLHNLRGVVADELLLRGVIRVRRAGGRVVVHLRTRNSCSSRQNVCTRYRGKASSRRALYA